VLSPPDLPEETLLRTLAEHWDITAAVYRPVGFGSHHWQVDTYWFVTAQLLAEHAPAIDRLRARHDESSTTS
jgi:spectinomycin phosphotransferase/16S rRNA (guanine(1405)-N(7))-methyltransferase